MKENSTKILEKILKKNCEHFGKEIDKIIEIKFWGNLIENVIQTFKENFEKSLIYLRKMLKKNFFLFWKILLKISEKNKKFRKFLKTFLK